MLEERDIVIAGGGLVGMSLALLLRSQIPKGIGITLLERGVLPVETQAEDQQLSFDSRATALSYGSKQIYQRVGIWSNLEAQSSSIKSIHVSSKGKFGSSLLEADSYGWPALGYVVENRALGSTLLSSILACDGIEIVGGSRVIDVKSTSESRTNLKVLSGQLPREILANLLVIADGAKSKLRRAFFIDATIRNFEQEAIVTNVEFELGHDNRAFERFTNDGSLAILPLVGSASHLHRCSLVWAVNQEKASMLDACDSEQFKLLLQQEFGYRLGRISHIGERVRFPLESIRSHEQVRPGVVVMGNAAHSLHPVAGQGFNLALRDAEILSRELSLALSKNFAVGDFRVLERYQAARMKDQQIIIGASNILPRLFAYQNPVLNFSRSVALATLDMLPSIKARIVYQAGGMLR